MVYLYLLSYIKNISYFCLAMRDPNTFTDFLNRHRAMVWRMCWLSARANYERCRDLVQEVSVALWLHFDQLRPEASLQEERAWVRWQTRSVLDLQRRLRKNVPVVPLTPVLEDSLPSSDSVPQREELDRLMESLGPDERHLLQMLLEGYRADEIGDALGTGRDVVYQRYHRALKKMRRVALLLLLIGIAVTVSVAVVPQWRQQVFRHEEKELPTVEEPSASTTESSPTLSEPPEPSVDTLAPRPAWIPPEPIPHLTSIVDTTLPELPQSKPEVQVTCYDKKLTLTGLLDGEMVIVRNPKGVLVALKRCHGSSCTIELPVNPKDPSARVYILQIGSRPDRIRIEL